MIAAVKESPEAGHLKAAALKYLTGVKGTLVQKKKRELEKAAESGNGGVGKANGTGNGSGVAENFSGHAGAPPPTILGGLADPFYRHARDALTAGLGRPSR